MIPSDFLGVFEGENVLHDHQIDIIFVQRKFRRHQFSKDVQIRRLILLNHQLVASREQVKVNEGFYDSSDCILKILAIFNVREVRRANQIDNELLVLLLNAHDFHIDAL